MARLRVTVSIGSGSYTPPHPLNTNEKAINNTEKAEIFLIFYTPQYSAFNNTI